MMMEFGRPKCRVHLVAWFVFVRTYVSLSMILFLETRQCKFQCNWAAWI